MKGFKNSTKTVADHVFPDMPGYAAGGIVARPPAAMVPQGSRISASRPIMPRPRVMPNAQTFKMGKLAKGGRLGDHDGGGGPYNPEEGNTLEMNNRPYSKDEQVHPRNSVRPGYSKGGIKVKKGALHKRMGVKQGSGIGTGRIQKDLSKAKKSGNSKAVKQDVFALNARKWHHKAEGGQVCDDAPVATVAQKVVNKHIASKPPQGHGVKPKGGLAFMRQPMFGK